jgi:Arylsulfotransferase (ASST)
MDLVRAVTGKRGRLEAAMAVTALAVVAACIGAAPALAESGKGLTISPAPGTPDASPATQISILGVAPQRIRSVSATGTETGVHPGGLHSYSGARGASFVPDAPFTEGEQVAVVVRVQGRDPVSFSFTIAHLGRIQPPLNLHQHQPDKLQHFVSRPGLIPPRISVQRRRGETRGSVFLTPLPSPVVHPDREPPITINPVGPGGPMIVDGSGNLVWFKQLAPPDVAGNLRLQRYRGRQVMTWWQGGVTPSAFGLGEGVIANQHYETIHTVHAGNGYEMDIHEFALTPSGDALFTVYSPVLVHLPGTPAGELSPLLDSIVQEVDVRTGLVTWEWHSYGHMPLADSYANPENSASYDAFHINSIQPLSDGRVLVSARDMSAVYKIDRASGRILWTLGGKASTFRFRKGARFWLQHDVQLVGKNRVSLFDDEAGPPKKGTSRGLVLALDMQRHTASLVHSYRRSKHTSAQSEGSVQTRPGGNVFVGFGSAPFFSEFSPEGRLLYDASLPRDDGTYRTFRYRWAGTPRTQPAVAAQRNSPSSVSVYASWNGATNVQRWQVLAGPSSTSLRPVAVAPFSGFETRIEVPSSESTFVVRALDSSGRVLATSPPTQAS